MQASDHASRWPNINWKRGQPMTDEELVALAAKCLLWNYPFQESTFFNEAMWQRVGTHGMEPQAVQDWTQITLESFKVANPQRNINRRIQKFLTWLKGKDYIHKQNYDPSSPNWKVSNQHIDELVEAIEKPQLLASAIFGSCDVFISHATRDQRAKELEEILRNIYKLNVYMTPERDPIEQGDNWPSDIVDHLKGARVVVIVLTKQSRKSPAVNQEIGFVLGSNKKRLVWFDGGTPAYILLPGNKQEYSQSSKDAQAVAKRVNELVQTLQ